MPLEKTLQRWLEDCTSMIKQCYNIDLTWGERAALKHYIRNFKIEKDKGNKGLIFHGDAMHLFMIDYFGLDSIELGCKITYVKENGFWSSKPFGLGLMSRGYYTSHPVLKKYCQERVQQWRDERELI